MTRPRRVGTKAGLAKVGLPKTQSEPHSDGMDDLRRMYAVMALRKPVRLSDGRKALITRVDTDFPANETTLHVWIQDEPDGAGLAKVSAAEVQEIEESPPAQAG